MPLSNNEHLIGLHFMISLCLYDGMLSLVMLAHGSLLADITTDNEERAQCNMWNSTFSLIGSGSVLISQFLWDKSDVNAFQTFCVVLCILSGFIFVFTSTILENEFSIYRRSENLVTSTTNSSSPKITSKNNNKLYFIDELIVFWKELQKLPNFWIFMIINLVQVFNCHFNSNFLSISMERLLNLDYQELSSRQISSLLLTSSALFPHALVIILTPIQKKIGLYRLLNYLFLWKLVVGLFVFIFGSVHHWTLIFLFIFVNKVFFFFRS